MVKRRNNRKGKAKRGTTRGRGDYINDVVNLAEAGINKLAINPKRKGTWQNVVAGEVGGGVGRALGSLVGFGGEGARLGSSASKALARWFGYGKYKLKGNTLLRNPPMHSAMEKIRVRHRECLGSVYSSATSGAFSAQLFRINPGDLNTFPWMATIAQAYQQWKPLGIMVSFNSEVSDTIASSYVATLGSIQMVTQYNVAQAAPLNKMQVLNEHFASEGKPSQDQCHPIECDPAQRLTKELLVRDTVTVADQQTYDLANFYFCSYGITTNSAPIELGTLWIEYDIELSMPTMAIAEGYSALSAHYQLATVTNTYTTGQTTGAATFDNIGLIVKGGIISWPSSSATNNYLVAYSVQGGSQAGAVATPVGSNGCTMLQYWLGDASSYPLVSATTTVLTLCVIVSINPNFEQYAGAPTLTIGTATLPTSVTHGDVFVTQINPRITT